MTDDDVAIEVDGVAKAYGSVTALAGVDLRAARGEVTALLGPNGAGKTTLVRVLGTLTAPDAGTARVAGHDVVADRREVRRRISLTGQHAALDELQTGEENLRMTARLRGLSAGDARRRAAELLERFDLVAAAGRRVATYSGGMRRRLDLAAGLVGEPEVVVLDEPTTGLDPRRRQELWHVVAELRDAGATVLLTTQYLEEADRLARRIAFVDAGRVVAEGSPAELKGRVAGERLDLTAADPAALDPLAARLGDRATGLDRERLVVGVATDGTAAHVRALLDEVDPDGRAVARLALHQASLDDVFLALTGHTPRSTPPARSTASTASEEVAAHA